jgi:hypothetical protein
MKDMGTPRKSTQALAGVLSASAALGVGHAVAAAMSRPAASPLIAVGSVAVDAAPTPVKEIAVRLLGNWDKPVLISGIGIVLLVAAAGIGLLAWRRPRTALVSIGALASSDRGRRSSAPASPPAGSGALYRRSSPLRSE